MTDRYKRYLSGIALVVWLMIVVCLYYVNHKPFGMEFAIHLMREVGQFLVALMIIFLAGGLGNFIYQYYKREFLPLTYPSLQAGLGLGLLAIGILIFNTWVGIKPLWIWIISLILLFFLRKYIRFWWSFHREFLDYWRQADLFGKIVAFGIGIILFFTFFPALAPPIKFDALVYHLALPEFYIQNSRMIYVAGNAYWGMPQLGEMLYTWGIALGGLETAAILGWMITILSLVGLLGFVSRNLGIKNGWVALATIFSGYTLAISSFWGYIDWYGFLFGLGTLVCLYDWQKRDQLSSVILAGVFAGFGLSTKYTAGVLIIVGLLVILWRIVKFNLLTRMRSIEEKNSAKSISIQTIKKGILFCSIATLVFSPWLIKNWLATRQPFYPFLFPYGSMDQFRLDFYQGLALWGNWWESTLLPLKATLEGVEGAPGYSASIGPLLLCMAPLAFIGIKKRDQEQTSFISTAAIITVVGIIIWILIPRLAGLLIQTRLYFALFPALAVLAAAGFDSTSRLNFASVRVNKIFESIILLVLWMNVIQISQYIERTGAIQETMAIISSDEYLDNNLGWFSPVMRYLNQLPGNAKVLMLWETRSLYCLPRCQPDELLDRWPAILNRFGNNVDPHQLLTELRSEGFNYLLFYKAGADFIREEDSRYKPSDWLALDDFLRMLATPTEFGDAYFLYPLSE